MEFIKDIDFYSYLPSIICSPRTKKLMTITIIIVRGLNVVECTGPLAFEITPDK